MRRSLIGVLLCILLLVATSAFSQSNGQVSGTIQDASKALMPGVTVTLTNKGTGITETRVSNEAGVYAFQSVPSGAYKITAELPGFRTSTTDDLPVGANTSVRWNFTLEVGDLRTQVEVSVPADQLIIDTTPSVGTVLPERRVTELPLVGQNVLDLLNVLPGFRSSPVADSASTVGGLGLDTVNATVNGLSTNSSRDSAGLWGRQVLTTNVINPDLIGEVKLILTPVDAELGRGNAQVQITTRSGTNQFRGSGVWNIQNSALNANTWLNKRNPGQPTQPNWYNLNQLTGSFGGPIIKNKTFFYALYDKQLVNRRTLVSSVVPTDTARMGIFRYWEGWNPAPALAPNPTTFAAPTATPTGTIASVDINGNPIAPAFNPTGGPYTLGGLKCFSVFGNVKVDGSPFSQADCPGGTAVINNTPWDSLRTGVDSTGIIKNVLTLMPHANFFANTGGANGTDGLNTASYRILQSTHGADPGSVNATIGVVGNGNTNDYQERSQINLRIDHNFNPNHRASVNWTYERTGGQLALSPWATGIDGENRRRPQFVTVNVISTLTPTFINEAKFGLNYSSEFAEPAWANASRPDIREKAAKFLLYGASNPNNKKAYPILFNPGTGWNGYMSLGASDFGNYSPLWDYGDTMRWTHQQHSLSWGGEYRRPETTGYTNSAYVNAAIGNASAVTTAQFFQTGNLNNGATQLPNFLGTARNNAGTLLNTLNGAIGAPTTAYWIDGQSDINNKTWQDVTTATNRLPSVDKYGHQTRTQISNEFSFFIKDDYKVTRRLTLNLGLRYDYNRSVYLTNGLTNRFAGDGLAMFGISRPAGKDPFAGWMSPGNVYLTGYGTSAANPLQCVQGGVNPNGIPASSCDPSLMSTVIFVGPKTNHPNQSLVPESGRFGPALGAAWQVPWFGEGKTTVRGGFQRTYGQAGSPFSGGLLGGYGSDGSSSTNLSLPGVASILSNRALNLNDLNLLVPAAPTRAPQTQVIPVGQRLNAISGSTYAMYDPNYKTPYTDNWTLSITRSLNRTMTLDVRTVNTFAKGQSAGGAFGSAGTFDLNTVNVYHNSELFKAFENTRAGIDDPLFDQMFMGLNFNPTITGYGAIGTTVGGVLQRGSAHIRRAFATNLANGNYVGVVNSLLGANNTTGLQTLPIDPSTNTLLVTSQRVLRNGCDRLANGTTLPGGAAGFTDPNTGAQILPRCFPENYVITNPQVTNAYYAKNLGHTSYHSFQTQFTMRPTYGATIQATYEWSKTMALPGSGFTDPLNPSLDYGRTLGSLGQDFRMNGTVELPIGPNTLFLGSSHGWIGRALEKWQLGFIYDISAGSPRSVLTSTNFLYANGRPNVVGPWKNPKGHVTWNGQSGNFFGNTTYATFPDPQCQNVTTKDNLQLSCTLVGLAQVVPQGTAGAVSISQGRFGLPLLQNPSPGNQGNLGSLTMATFPRRSLDGNLSKTFKISETKSAQVRFDATNILNHPTPSDPVGVANVAGFQDTAGNAFGTILTKTGNRTFQGKLRINF